MKKKDFYTLIQEIQIEYKVLDSYIKNGIELILTQYEDYFFIFIRDQNGFHCIDKVYTLIDTKERFDSWKNNIFFHIDLGPTSMLEYKQPPTEMFPTSNYTLVPFKDSSYLVNEIKKHLPKETEVE